MNQILFLFIIVLNFSISAFNFNPNQQNNFFNFNKEQFLPNLYQSYQEQRNNWQEILKQEINFDDYNDETEINNIHRSIASHGFPVPPPFSQVFIQGPIKPTDFNTNAATGTAMLTITTPGRYFLSDDIILEPSNDNVIGLKIAVDNVAIDLSSHTISQSSTTTATKTISAAVQVDSNLANIAVINGLINNINGTGLKVLSGCRNMLFEGLVIDNCYNIGMDIENLKNMIVNSLAITNCTDTNAQATTGAIGLRLKDSRNIRMGNGYFNAMNSTANDAIGMLIQNCCGCRFADCTASGQKGKNAYGFKITGTSSACVFRDSASIVNEATNGTCSGLYSEYSRGISLVDFFTGSNKASGGNSTGISIKNGDYILTFNCLTQNNSSATHDCFGLKLDTVKNSKFITTNSIGNVSTSSSAYGFYLNKCQSNFFYYCEAKGQDASSGTKDAYGFYCTQGAGNAFDHSKAVNTKGGIALTSIAAGFAFRVGESYSSVNECIASGSSTNGEAYGIMLGHTNDPAQPAYSTINKSYMVYNLGSKKYGYRDFADNSTTLLAASVSYGHGAINPSTTEQLSLTNAMNFMFTYTTAQYPGNLIIEKSIGDLSTITNDTPFSNFSIKLYP